MAGICHPAVSPALWLLLVGVPHTPTSGFSKTPKPAIPPPPFPKLPSDMVRQAASSITSAFLHDSIHLQTIRLPLSETMYGNKEEGYVADRAMGWQGGPQETSRFLSPLVTQLLKTVRTTEENTGNLPPRITDQVVLDFDGSSLQTAESAAGPIGDAQALLQPNTDNYYLDLIAKIEDSFCFSGTNNSKSNKNAADNKNKSNNKHQRLFLLINPAWRDRKSWGFFGGDRAQSLVLDRYPITYALDQFVVRGERMSLLKVWGWDWCVFWNPINVGEDDDEGGPRLVGKSKERPEYSKVDEFLRDAMKKMV